VCANDQIPESLVALNPQAQKLLRQSQASANGVDRHTGFGGNLAERAIEDGSQSECSSLLLWQLAEQPQKLGPEPSSRNALALGRLARDERELELCGSRDAPRIAGGGARTGQRQAPGYADGEANDARFSPIAREGAEHGHEAFLQGVVRFADRGERALEETTERRHQTVEQGALGPCVATDGA